MSKIKIALTGTIGAGKTVVSDYLRKKGYDVFDCDLENKKLLNNYAYELLYKDFKECFVDKCLDSKALAKLIFTDIKKKEKLESIMHPLILDKLNKRNDDILFAEVPLLFEANWDKYFDIKILIVCDYDTSINRLINRGLSKTEAIDRINNQMPLDLKKQKADIIIYNNGNFKQLYETIDSTLDNLL